MARRSRSQRPQKIRNSDAPALREAPPAAKAVDGIRESSEVAAAAAPVDEMAALDAGWDEVS
jgi:hypothetical protein